MPTVCFSSPSLWHALSDPLCPVLNYALTLEHLEDKFYRDGLANYTQAQFAAAGFDATFYNNLKTISKDEQVHVKFLTDALTGTPLPSSLFSNLDSD